MLKHVHTTYIWKGIDFFLYYWIDRVFKIKWDKPIFLSHVKAMEKIIGTATAFDAVIFISTMLPLPVVYWNLYVIIISIFSIFYGQFCSL